MEKETRLKNLKEGKIGNLEQVSLIVDELKKEGKRIAYVEGVFDLCLLGHKELVDFAKEQGDVVVVGVASDEYAATKGPDRPVFTIDQRAELISAFGKVDFVITLENPPSKPGSQEADEYLNKITNRLRPDVIVASTTTDTNPEAKRIRAELCGAKFVPQNDERPTAYSSTKVIQKALELLS